MLNYNKEDVLYAGFFVRLSAYIIDCILVGLVLLVVKIPKFIMYLMNSDMFIFKPVLFKFSTMDIVIYLLGLTYFVVMTYLYGATLGKKAMNIKVCKSTDEKLSLIDVIYRESIGRYLSALIIFIGYLMIAADSKKRGFHDMLCDTIVVYDFGKQRRKNEKKNINEVNLLGNEVIKNDNEEIIVEDTKVNNENNVEITEDDNKMTEIIVEKIDLNEDGNKAN